MRQARTRSSPQQARKEAHHAAHGLEPVFLVGVELELEWGHLRSSSLFAPPPSHTLASSESAAPGRMKRSSAPRVNAAMVSLRTPLVQANVETMGDRIGGRPLDGAAGER